MKKFITIGVDLAKNYFRTHALESEDGHAATRKLSRQAMHKFFSEAKPLAARRIIWRANCGRWATRCV